MPNRGTLELHLLDVADQPAADPATRVVVFRGTSSEVLHRSTHAFPPARRFELPAFPDERLLAVFVEPKRYRRREVGFLTLGTAEPSVRKPTVFRLPGEWDAEFVPWNSLGPEFQSLKDVLDVSDELKVRRGRRLGRLVEQAYDGIADEREVLAKACLLNLFAKMQSIREPIHRRLSWFSFVTHLLEIDRERFLAVVKPEMRDRLFEVHDRTRDFPDYTRTNANNHRKNIPSAFRIERIKSLKTDEQNGNLQLTVAQTRSSDGDEIIVLDADIDENGHWAKHLADLFKHKVTGGTHPYDIHEFLVKEDAGRGLGYRLV